MNGVLFSKDAVKQSIVVVRPTTGVLNLDLKAIWDYRELIYFLIWRDIKVRYKQTAIGAGWAIFQPLMAMMIFTVVFGNFAKIPSDGLPYPLFTYTALLPWNYFAQALSRSGTSLVGNADLIRKVYFPRLIVPLSAAIAPLVDFGVAFAILLGMLAWFRIVPNWHVLAVPIFLFITVLTGLAAGLWLSALHVKYRDVGYTIPFLIQLWMYASPVVYPVGIVPVKVRFLYGLNPMAGVIEGFRWSLLKRGAPDVEVIVISTVVIAALLIGGLAYFGKTEEAFADIV